MSARQSLLSRTKSGLAGARGPYWLSLLALAMALPALSLGLQSDDHVLALSVERGEPAWSLFRTAPEALAEWRDNGALAWWASPLLSVQFLRPLASLSHFVDFSLWPGAAWWMMLCNALVYAGSVFVAALLYRRLAPSAGAGALAALLFTIDDAHAMSVGWISGRNTLLALLGALTALLFQLRAQDEGRPALRYASAAAVAFALSSAEAGVWALCLLVAHSATLAKGPLRQRMSGIAPQLAVGLVWMLVYLGLGCGVHGTSFYRELGQPLHALLQGVLALPLTTSSLFGPSVAGFGLLYPVTLARLCALPIAAICALSIWPARTWSPAWRFFALSTALCLVPSFLTVAQDRVMMGASFGAFGWIAMAIAEASTTRWLDRARRGLLVTLHLVLSSLAYPMNLMSLQRFEHGTQALLSVIEPGREVILVNTPLELLSSYTLAVVGRAARRAQAPAALHQLYSGGSELVLERIDAHTLDVSAERGWGHSPIERIFCAPEDLPKPGSEVLARHVLVRVMASTEDGAPRRVRFRFDTDLESPEHQWLMWRGTAPVALAPPKIGERLQIPALSLVNSLPP